MRRPDHNTTALPRSLREELGFPDETSRPNRGKRTDPSLRKEHRKAARTVKKAKALQKPPGVSERSRRVSTSTTHERTSERLVQKPIRSVRTQDQVKDASLRQAPRPQRRKRESSSEDSETDSNQSIRPKHVSRGVKDKLAAEDAEIAALEKALGVKENKKLPKSFEDDGLDALLEGWKDELDRNTIYRKRPRDEGEEWLEAKRKKARRADREANIAEEESLTERDESGGSLDGLSNEEGELKDSGSSLDSQSDEFASRGFDESVLSEEPPKKKVRENPYKAPDTSAIAAPKYIPPSRRNQVSSETEDLSRLRRQIQGLINRLSEANMLSVLEDVNSLYRTNARQYVSSTILDLVLGLLCDPAGLQDTFVILHAGFIVALYKTVGPDFGAQVVQKVDEDFRLNYEMESNDTRKGKKLVNLINLMSQLYIFQMVSSNLIYDYIKLFAAGLSEEKVELLLKCVRSAGPQLRQDNPSALKEIVLLVQNAVARIGEKNLSVRTKFMIETINNLKNNRMKTGLAASEVTSEHTVRMKKALGSLNTRNIKATEPLRVGLRDIRESDKRGKWWLIGASYRDPAEGAQRDAASLQDRTSQEPEELNLAQDASRDLLQIAREQRMNTDVRRSIFVGIMSATDYNDAFQRLMKLRLKKSQEIEIPKVIIHCASAEEAYNPYYTLLARRICSDRKLKMAFQFSLWDLFKHMGEGSDGGPDEAEEEEDAGDEKLGMRNIVNLARTFGTLIAEGGLSLNVLKILNIPYLQPKTRTFLELLIITIILRSQKGVHDSKDENSISDIFMQVKDNSEMSKGLQYFLRKTVSKTDIAGLRRRQRQIVGIFLRALTFVSPYLAIMIRSFLPRVAATPISRRASTPLIASSVYAFQQPKYCLLRPKDRSYATEAEQHDLVIIGGGVAGYVAAIKAGQEGLKVACIEKRGALGGTCLNVGCIPSKSLLNNSHMYHQILHDTKKRGIDVGDVKLNLKQMMAAKDTSVQGLTKGVEFLFKKNNVEYVPGTGALASEHEVKVNKIDGGEATYLAKNILIATGSEATPFPGLTIDEKMVVTSTGAIALDTVPKKMVVIGGGIIGLEMGSVWSRLGADVTVVEFLGQIGGPGMDAEISKTTQKILTKQGMKFKLNTKVVSGDDSGEGVKLEVEAAKGGKKETLDADVVLVAIGRRPYTAGLGLENVGLDVDNKGRLVIDEQYRTKVPHIRVIGDCTFGPMLAHKAEEEAVAVIEYITKGHGHVNYGAIPSVMYTHPEVAWVGQNEAELKEQGVKYRVGSFPFTANSRAKTNLETEGMVKFISDAETDRILGIHIVGPNAGEMIAEGVLAVEYGASSEDVARTSHAHPTLAEAFKEAAMATYSKAIHY
ncbi:MAG: hypothetical protein LQ338_006880 [Usnochroma carphineum]|nr:MAG: hypothetical protein LQ338_006880 [Usnochroma carphineum]